MQVWRRGVALQGSRRRLFSSAGEAQRAVEDERARKKARPEFTAGPVGEHVKQAYGLNLAKELRILNSYDDQNFLAVTSAGVKLLVKVHNGVESGDQSYLAGQTALYRRLKEHQIGAPYPVSPLVCDAATAVSTLEGSGEWNHAVRVLEWVDGTPLSDTGGITPEDMSAAGEFLAGMRGALDGFDHPGLHRPHMWDLRHTLMLRQFSAGLKGEEAEMVEEVLARFEAAEVLHELPFGILQGDYNDANIVMRPGGGVSGVIDFGDCVYSWRLIDHAVGAAYMCINIATPGRTNPGFPEGDILAAASAFITAALRASPTLTTAEKEALPLLCTCRLAASATMGSYSYQRSLEENPDMAPEQREYLLFHARPAWSALRFVLPKLRDGSAAKQLCGGA
eukprot:Hpha_TRINITY_DN34681_c0_g1::TRINITY_DN34681_c0_g1_i1::g.21080::m.21080/K18201/AGPHD1; hydroxylysine kinase